MYKRRFNRNVDQSMSTRRKSASNLGMPGDDRLSQIAEKFSMDMFQMQRAASREDGQRPRIEPGCRFPLDKEVGDCLSSCKKFRIPFQTFFFCNNYTKKFLIVFLAYLLLKNLD